MLTLMFTLASSFIFLSPNYYHTAGPIEKSQCRQVLTFALTMFSYNHKPINKKLLRLVVFAQRTMQKYKEKKSLYLNLNRYGWFRLFSSYSKSTLVTRMMFRNTCTNYRSEYLNFYLLSKLSVTSLYLTGISKSCLLVFINVLGTWQAE